MQSRWRRRSLTGTAAKLTAHTKFQTAKWFLLKTRRQIRHALDLILPGAHETYKYPAGVPTVKMGSMDDDIRRRDFTINALAIAGWPHFGELRDDLNGMDDLKNGIDPGLCIQSSLIDDPTRMFRAVRYARRYEFEIAEETLALIPTACRLIENSPPQRICHELDLILEESNSAPCLRGWRS